MWFISLNSVISRWFWRTYYAVNEPIIRILTCVPHITCLKASILLPPQLKAFSNFTHQLKASF